MTDNERKQAEEILRNELNIARLSPLQFDGIMRSMKAFAALKVAEATKEMYPAAFVEWANWCEFAYDSDKDRYMWTVFKRNSLEVEYECDTTDELFEYWKENKQ